MFSGAYPRRRGWAELGRLPRSFGGRGRSVSLSPHLGFHGCEMNTAIRASWRRGGDRWTVFPDLWSFLGIEVNRAKNTNAETSGEAALARGIFWDGALRAFFFSHVFCFTKNWSLANRQVPWRLAQSRRLFCCDVAFRIFSHLGFWGRTPGCGWAAAGRGEGMSQWYGERQKAFSEPPSVIPSFVSFLSSLPRMKAAQGFG